MKMNKITVGSIEITEILSDQILLKSEKDALDLLSEVQSDYIVLHEQNVDKDFFDLSTKIAGDILQKFTNYRIKLAVVGDFDRYPSKTLKDFIYECNKTKDHLFVKTTDEALHLWDED